MELKPIVPHVDKIFRDIIPGPNRVMVVMKDISEVTDAGVIKPEASVKQERDSLWEERAEMGIYCIQGSDQYRDKYLYLSHGSRPSATLTRSGYVMLIFHEGHVEAIRDPYYPPTITAEA